MKLRQIALALLVNTLTYAQATDYADMSLKELNIAAKRVSAELVASY